MESLQNIIKSKRKELKLSLREAGDLIGISHSYLSTLEKGIDPRTGSPIKPTTETLKLISKAYKIDYEELMIATGYLKKYDNINVETLKDEDFNRILPVILKHLSESILKYDDNENKDFTKNLDLNETWQYLSNEEKTKLLISAIKEAKYNKQNNSVSLTQYFDITEEEFQTIKKDYIEFLAEQTNDRTLYVNDGSSILEESEEKYPKSNDIIEYVIEEAEKHGYNLRDKSKEEIAKIVVKALKIDEISKSN